MPTDRTNFLAMLVETKNIFTPYYMHGFNE